MLTAVSKHPELDEIENQIRWFEDLLETVRAGDVELAECTIWAAIHLLERQKAAMSPGMGFRETGGL